MGKCIISSNLREITSMMNMKLYLDMDQVITDFEKSVKKLGQEKGLAENATEEEKVAMWQAIDAAGEDFWHNMKWHPKGKKLWNLLKKYNPVLLSSPGQLQHAKVGKELWVRDNLPGVTLIVEPEKYKYAEMDAILIDDMKNNIGAWNEAGGIGLLYQWEPEETAKELKRIIKEKQLVYSYETERERKQKEERIRKQQEKRRRQGPIEIPEEFKKKYLERLKKDKLVGVPKTWEKELKQKREKVETLDPALKKQLLESLLKKIEDKKINTPSRFVQHLNRIMTYVKEMKDPKSRGLYDDLSKLMDETLHKKNELILNADMQKKLFEKAEKLEDDGTLLKDLRDLFEEKYKRASIAQVIRALSTELL